MLKSCFHADISPSLADSILIKQKPASYLVRQGDRDPSKLILSFYKDGRTKHIVKDKDRLEDPSYEVDKLLVSYDCRHRHTVKISKGIFPKEIFQGNFFQRNYFFRNFFPTEIFSNVFMSKDLKFQEIFSNGIFFQLKICP